ncbi:Electron transport complex protein RnfE [Pseudomonas chlororaphis subsp. aurantiaca]|nr:Electron transport complex protein RnfE [Pseudomonas chlororaphis subsp. aurantiaca]
MNKSSTLQNALMLAPLIGASDSLVKALGLALVFLCVSCVFGLCMNALRPRLAGQGRLGASILLSTTLTSCAMLAAQAWAFELQQQLALYLGLIAVQCVVLEYQDFSSAPCACALPACSACCWLSWARCAKPSAVAPSAIICNGCWG